jgi:hypothetical protein
MSQNKVQWLAAVKVINGYSCSMKAEEIFNWMRDFSFSRSVLVHIVRHLYEHSLYVPWEQKAGGCRHM